MHPLTPLLPEEIKACHSILKSGFPLPTGNDYHFKTITLLEPPKSDLLSWNEGSGSAPQPPRRGYIVYYIRYTDKLYEATVDLSTSKLLSNARVKSGVHAPADGGELEKIESIVLNDAGVRAEIEKLLLPAGTVVVADPWIYGSDGISDKRLQFQVFMYVQPDASHGPDSNHYAAPISVSPVVDVQTLKVVRIDHLPMGVDFTPTPPKPFSIPPANEYMPEYQKLRGGLKPLHVVQPEGASFTVTEEAEARGSGGATIEWQKWKLRTGFNAREGMVLYNIQYDGRDIAYRIALSDMTIPYADPRPPFHRKQAFDLGDVVR